MNLYFSTYDKDALEHWVTAFSLFWAYVGCWFAFQVTIQPFVNAISIPELPLWNHVLHFTAYYCILLHIRGCYCILLHINAILHLCSEHMLVCVPSDNWERNYHPELPLCNPLLHITTLEWEMLPPIQFTI